MLVFVVIIAALGGILAGFLEFVDEKGGGGSKHRNHRNHHRRRW